MLLLISLTGHAQSVIDSLSLQLESSTERSEKIDLLQDLAWEYTHSNIDSSKLYAERALILAESVSDQDEMANSRAIMAIIHDIEGDIEAAAGLFLEVARYYEDQKNLIELSTTYNNLGIMFFEDEDFDQAYRYLSKSLELEKVVGDSLGIAASLVNLASIEHKRGAFTEASTKLKIAKSLVIDEDEMHWIRLAVYNEIGAHLTYLDQYDSSLQYLRQVLPLYLKAEDLLGALTAMVGIVEAETALGQYQDAISNLKRGEALLKRYPDLTQKKKLMGAAAMLYAKTDRYDKAFEYQRNFQMVSDSLLTLGRIKSVNALEKKFQSELKESEIARLEVAQQTSANQRNILLAIAIVLVTAAIFLYVLLSQRSRSNALIKRSLSEKELLLKEIHHRVKNNLQVISSLLRLQSRYIEDKAAQNAVHESQNRVKSMALIHENLYQEDNLIGVQAAAYINNLTEVLKSSFGVDEDKVKVESNIASLVIDIDTIIPLGLILNELITNAFKHAFPGEVVGIVRLELKEIDEKLELVVADTGVGKSLQKDPSNSFGMMMIESLAAKLEAIVDYQFDAGTRVALSINNYKLV